MNLNTGHKKRRNQSGEHINKTKKMYNETQETNGNGKLEKTQQLEDLEKYIKQSRLSPQGEHSELITVDNQVAAIFVKEGYENLMPQELVQFAAERKLPLIVVSATQNL